MKERSCPVTFTTLRRPHFTVLRRDFGQFALIIVVHFTVHFESPDFLVPHSTRPSPINLNRSSRELRHISSCKSFMEPILPSPT